MPLKRSMCPVGETVSLAGLWMPGGREPARTGLHGTRLVPAHAASGGRTSGWGEGRALRLV